MGVSYASDSFKNLDTLKVLGIILDAKGSLLDTHVSEVTRGFCARAHALSTMYSQNWGPSFQSTYMLYRGYVEPALRKDAGFFYVQGDYQKTVNEDK